MPRISVHIVTHNSAATIEACLTALRQQTCDDVHLLVIDNNSTDNTVQLVEALGVRVQRSPSNIGYSAAHNQAIAAADSEYVLTLNPDVWLAPSFLDRLLAALDSAPEAGSASGCLLRVEQLGAPPATVDSAGLFMRRTRRQGLRAEGCPVSERPTEPATIFGPDGAAAFYRRAMLDDIRVMGEVFDENFFMHKEDVDVCWRAQLRGWSSLYVPDALAHHIRTFRPGQRQQVSSDLRFYGVRNRYLMLLKNESVSHVLRDLPFIAAYDLAIILYMLLREPRSLRALWSAAKLSRRMLQKRRLIQSGRRADWRAIARAFHA